MKDNAYTFSRAPQIDTPRSVFRRNHDLMTTIDVDNLYPIYIDECLPGDTFEFSQNIFGRLTTPLTPLMDDLYLDTFYFAVPVRLIDENFRKLMGESPVGLPDSNLTAPMINSGSDGVDFGSLYDYMLIPPKVKNLDFSPWFARAYTYVWNDWFRDANIIDPRPVFGSFDYAPSSGTESVESYTLLKRAKRLDYFTGCLPWPQRGPTTYLPLQGEAPVYGNGRPIGILFKGSNDNWSQGFLGSADAAGNYGLRASQVIDASTGSPATTVIKGAFGLGNKEGSFGTNIYADLSEATAITVNQLREAIAVQHLYEAFARGGSNRYIEILRSAFGVISPDARLQRSEYLGGASVRMNVTTVAQTSSSTEESPLGNLASFVTVSSNAYWKKSFTEHTIIIGVANVRARLSYSQGLPRMYSRKTKLDFYWPQLANLGEQAVLNKEIFAQGTSADEDVFGYQERWAEYRYHPNMITGAFRPTHPRSLDVWHLSQEFESLPSLNQSFIEEAVPIDRVVAVTNEPPLMLWGSFNLKCARPMPLYSIPGLERM